MHERYEEWLAHVFDRPVTKKGWYFDIDVEHFEAPSVDITLLVTQTCTHAERDLAKFSNGQVAHGIHYIFNNSCSDLVFDLKAKKVKTPLRVECVKSLYYLYKDCFAKRCLPVLSSLNEGRKSPLNSACYMLWDTSPLGNWEKDKEKSLFHSTLIDLHVSVLNLGHDACTESALHGLGHLHLYSPKAVEKAVDGWLQKQTQLRPELLTYAKAARNGHVL